MVDSRQYWMDRVLRQVAEENMNPEVLSRDYGDPRFSRRPMQPESRPFMGDWLPALADKIGSGIGGAARWVDENVPSMGGPVDAELLASFIQPLRGSDLGATGTHAGDVYPGVPKAAGMVIGPAAAFAPKGYRAIKRLFGGADEAVDQLKLPGTARTEKKKLTPEEIRAKKDKETIKKEQEAVRPNKLFSDSLDHDLEIRELSRARYDELIDDGWDHFDIMNEHEIIPSAKRREGASPVRKVPKNPKQLTDEEYDLMFGLEKDLKKLLEVDQLISEAVENIDPNALAFIEIQPIKKMAKKIGWRGPVNKETQDAIVELTLDKYDKLRMRSEFWNVDTHIKRRPAILEPWGTGPYKSDMLDFQFRTLQNYGRDAYVPIGETFDDGSDFADDVWQNWFDQPEIELDTRRLLDTESGDEYFRIKEEDFWE
tara:strand:- start:323 stop:1603 length:1281 start_codon:yes stop_codon:yes gene_type:complete